MYEALAGTGLEYGPSFRGLRAAWLGDGEVFAEVVLPEGVSPAGFGLHPALLDAVAARARARRGPDGGDGRARRGCRSRGRACSLHAAGAVLLRARIRR